MSIERFCGFYTQMRKAFPYMEMQTNFSFARHTTIGCGGVAKLALFPKNSEECASALIFIKNQNIPYCLLGVGANVLPNDRNFDGVVVSFRRLKKIRIVDDLLFVGAGVTGGELCRFARINGLSGVEFLTGIPMSVGGAVAMNAGVEGRHISDCVQTIVAIEEDKIKFFHKEDCKFSIKQSVFQNKIAVTGAFLSLKPQSILQIEKNTVYYRNRRKHLPKGRSMGCVFVNPNGVSAGALIERCGLKGLRFGNASVSEIHANFIINQGGTAEQIERLIETVKLNVHIKTGILLQEEIRRLP